MGYSPLDPFCYVEEWYCPEEANGRILEKAEELYGAGYEWGDYSELDETKRGKPVDGSNDFLPAPEGNWLPEIDCHYLVSNTLEILHLPVPVSKSLPLGKSPDYVFGEHFCQIDIACAGKGDIVFFFVSGSKGSWDTAGPFGSNHIGIIETNRDALPLEEGDWCREGRYFSSDAGEDVDYQDWKSDSCGLEGRSNRWQNPRWMRITIWRPKERRFKQEDCGSPSVPEEGKEAPVIDPVLLDLDRNGIVTMGSDAGIYFDHDGDGFKELTGWVAPGDGMLMLDVNGNGRLDDGSELFGDSMLLADGKPAANGFEALAQYDSNKDGRIDSQDPVWSQLLVWQHASYIPTAGDG